MSKDYYEIAERIQDASNPIAVVGELREAMMDARTHGKSERKDPAVIAIFFKVYDMMGAPSEKEMYAALKTCEVLNDARKHAQSKGAFGAKKKPIKRR